VADWATISALATAGGTLALAGATYAAVRSSNRSARVAEQALQEQRRPLLVHARLDDPVQKVLFLGGHWVRTEGNQAVVDDEDGVIYLAIPLRNVGSGIAVLQGWYAWPDIVTHEVSPSPPEEFHRQTRDIYVAPGEVDVWQGAFRDPNDHVRDQIAAARTERRPFSIDLLYSDQVGGQRTISRFTLTPAREEGWLGSAGLHWNLDFAGPRE
jgi:hypothetical protein